MPAGAGLGLRDVDQSWCPGPHVHVLVSPDWTRGVSWDDGPVDVGITRDAARGAPSVTA